MTAKNRWYDKDPALSKAMETLRDASDKYQAQIALNIIKIIVEHRIEDSSNGTVTSDQVEAYLQEARTHEDRAQSRRWYDVNETLRSAIHLLRDTPEEIQAQVIPTIANMIDQTLCKEI